MTWQQPLVVTLAEQLTTPSAKPHIFRPSCGNITYLRYGDVGREYIQREETKIESTIGIQSNSSLSSLIPQSPEAMQWLNSAVLTICRWVICIPWIEYRWKRKVWKRVCSKIRWITLNIVPAERLESITPRGDWDHMMRQDTLKDWVCIFISFGVLLSYTMQYARIEKSPSQNTCVEWICER